MHTTIPNEQELIAFTKNDIQNAEALLALLNAERGALADRDFDSLEQIIVDKAARLEQLDASAKMRSEWARGYGKGDTEDNWRQLIANIKSPEFIESWKLLKGLLDECRLENEVNGKAISRNHTMVNRILNLLRGQAENSSLYNASGESTGSGQSQHMGEA